MSKGDSTTIFPSHISYETFCRLLHEENELVIKINSLQTFLNSFALLPYLDSTIVRPRKLSASELLLLDQLKAMVAYADILATRIDLAWLTSRHVYAEASPLDPLILKRCDKL